MKIFDSRKKIGFFLLKCFTFISLVIASVTISRRRTAIISNLFNTGIANVSSTDDCYDIDQCVYLRSNCHELNNFYLQIYYCFNLWKPFSIFILLFCLLIFFGAISIVASDFFCPNLQIISKKLNLSESMAGVTVLAFGNGSPDIFSTFSAMDAGSGSLAIGELIGAAFFIVAFVAGCMGIIRPFQAQKIVFVRDASFLAGAIMLIIWIIYHQRIYWYHSMILIGYYCLYVLVVVLGTTSFVTGEEKKIKTVEEDNKATVDESSYLLNQPGKNKPSRLTIPEHGFPLSIGSNLSDYACQSSLLGRLTRPPMSPNNSCSSRSIYYDAIMPKSASTIASISTLKSPLRRPMTPRIGIRTSVFGAIEFREQVNMMRRANSTHNLLLSPSNYPRRQTSMPQHVWKGYVTSEVNNSGNSTQDPRLLSPISPRHRFTNSNTVDNTIYERRDTSTTVPNLPSTTIAPTITISPSSYGDNDPTDQQQQQQQQQQDYFSYLSSTEQQQLSIRLHSPNSPSLTSSPSVPEIRLAPPNTNRKEEEEQEGPSFILDTNHNTNDVDHLSPYFGCSSKESSFSNEKHDTSCHQSLLDEPSSSSSLLLLKDHSYATNNNNSQHQTLSIPRSDSSYMSMLSALSNHPENMISTKSSVGRLMEYLFPSLIGWRNKSFFGKLNAFFAAPLLLVFILTLPVVAEGEEISHNESYSSIVIASSPLIEEGNSIRSVVDQNWNKHLLMIQCIFSMLFASSIFAVNELVSLSIAILYGSIIGWLLSICVLKMTKTDQPPSWYWMISFLGFFIALNWIFLLANEVVSLLQAIGEIFSISEAIMGLTVFAFCNSVGDLVTNTAIAKMGFPTMAISACYAGPLLNTVLGIGVSSCYQIWKSDTFYQLEIEPTIIISAIGALLTLISVLFVVSLNGYRMTKKLGIWMIFIYFTCYVINFLFEFDVLNIP